VIVDYLKKNIALYKKKKSVIPSNNSTETATFYDKNTDKFLDVYGEVIQAFRTKNVNDYLDYTIESAELKDGQQYLMLVVAWVDRLVILLQSLMYQFRD
jgi:hypothetical protein